MFSSKMLTQDKIVIGEKKEINEYDDLSLKIQGIKVLCMIMQNKRKYQDYTFNNDECFRFWNGFHILCSSVNKDIIIFNTRLFTGKMDINNVDTTVDNNVDTTVDNISCLNDLSYEIDVSITRLKTIKTFKINKILDMHLKRRLYFKWVFNDYLVGGDIQLIHPLTNERLEISYHNGHHHIFIFLGKNINETQITLEDEFQHTICYDEAYNEIHHFQLSVNYIYKYLNLGFIPTIIRHRSLMGFDHFCNYQSLKDIMMSDSINTFNIDFDDN